jgi:Domain of unknown function (DUF4276)
MRRLVLFVEGKGDEDALPTLVKRVLNEHHGWHDDVLLDNDAFRVGEVNKLIRDDFRFWNRFLNASLKRRNVGAVLLVLDGDSKRIGGEEFCAAAVARSLAIAATHVGAGRSFSVAVVFARQEFETWLIAGLPSLVGGRLPDGRLIEANMKAPGGDLEASPRDAKGWLRAAVNGGYNPSRDQAAFTKLVDLEVIRARNLRSFRRLESAVSNLLQAIRCDKPIASPS